MHEDFNIYLNIVDTAFNSLNQVCLKGVNVETKTIPECKYKYKHVFLKCTFWAHYDQIQGLHYESLRDIGYIYICAL